MDTTTTQLQELSGAACRSACIGDILICALHVRFAGVNGGMARILLAIEVGARLAFQSIGIFGRCYV